MKKINVVDLKALDTYTPYPLHLELGGIASRKDVSGALFDMPFHLMPTLGFPNQKALARSLGRKKVA